MRQLHRRRVLHQEDAVGGEVHLDDLGAAQGHAEVVDDSPVDSGLSHDLDPQPPGVPGHR